MYVDMVNFVYRNYLDLGCYKKDLNELSERIQNFKAAALKNSSDYQDFKMKSRTLLALDHVYDAIREVGDLV